jgi:hypothetical protein
MLRARGRPDEADAVLAEERARPGADAAPWSAAAVVAARRGDLDGDKQLLDEARAKLGDRVELRLALLESWAEPEEEVRDGAVASATADADALPPADRTRLLCRAAEAYYRVGKADKGDRLCRQLAGRPADLGGRLLMLDAAVQCRDAEKAGRVLADVRRLEGEDGTWWRYGEAARGVARAFRGDRSGLDAARGRLAEVNAWRPGWPRAALLEAQLAELDGDVAKAAAAYGKVFDAGDRQPEVAARLLALASSGRWDEADRVVRRLQEEAVVRVGLARPGAEAALRAHDEGRAVELARAAAPATASGSAACWTRRVGRPRPSCGRRCGWPAPIGGRRRRWRVTWPRTAGRRRPTT